MKTLLLLRHAKSSWKDSEVDDFDRPLNKRGKREAPRMGLLIREEDLLPDLVLSSSARRARKTAEHVIQSSGYRGETRFTSDLYEASSWKLLECLRSVNDQHQRVLLVGHNPGLEALLESLVGAYTPLSTGSLAHLLVEIDSWQQLTDESRAQLVALWQPRELG